jgi:hypothetical protein
VFELNAQVVCPVAPDVIVMSVGLQLTVSPFPGLTPLVMVTVPAKLFILTKLAVA